MNDQHPHAGYVGHDSHPTGNFDTDPLFGALPAQQNAQYETYDVGYATPYASPAGQQGNSGQYDSAPWDTGSHQQTLHDAYAAQPHAQTAQQYDATASWTTGSDQTGEPAQGGQWTGSDTDVFPSATYSTTGFDTGGYGTTEYGTNGYGTGGYEATGYEATGYETGGYGGTGYEAPGSATGGYETGAYDATAWNSCAMPGTAPYEPEQTSHPLYEQQTAEAGTAGYSATGGAPGGLYRTEAADGPDLQDGYAAYEYAECDPHDVNRANISDDTTGEHHRVTELAASRPASRGGSRGRRRTPARRSALLTVAVPSVCAMSVAGIAAASVSGVSGDDKADETTSMAAADPATVKPVAANHELDTQLANLSADAENFADRASRTQERIDLKERQAADKKKREAEAARREALRPKFVLPVKQHGLSAYYGQAGVNWMSVHTGIDFPVSYGTPVMAATDGTVRTQWNSAYGNMAIVTAPDGTETWYCHLSSTKIRSGSVQAGDVIAYSGNSGNSTGPHMHFEVRPGGGSAIDPLPWLRGHHINPN